MSDIRVSKAQNLARIRDNQRRSRARRKEYLHELETKLRSYEQIGIEASSEIQSAARRVLDENRKLRSLLHERGVSESEIVAALEGMSDRRYEHDTAASRLHAMLERRVNTNVIPSTSLPIPSHTRAASMPRQKPSVPPVTIPPTRPTALSYNDSPSPGSMVSSMSTPPPASYPATLYTTPMTPSAAQIKSEHVQYDYPYDQPYSSAWAYSSDCNYTAEPVSYYNGSSCVDAANIIRTMRAGVGPELEVDLGRHTSDRHCYINNATISNVMDRYSQHNAPI
ncbi:uncharacterized protein ALTATR162_LOCUS6508 [Alternaria atra]|uniref:BZIP domain-containing protein n=1 Tax=Alternaria atra TaxID=119953 RepID=A0A8J2N0V2_9PLEO|nr:uncharacterized protein ALTATR162_LOCUS6508 [Alternaria atra]CAG5163622.1 unnamed protein product [Alternaria atra]